jgi:hypothetical protein
MVSTSIQSVNIRPEVSILSILKSVNYKAWYAIAEFVDNAIQSALSDYPALVKIEGDQYRLRVEIEIDNAEGNEKITIRDNAGGISAENFSRAFRPASLPTDRSGLSEFGMGMKSAACWFADFWTVRTSAVGENIERIVTFDVKGIVAHQIENIPIQERLVSSNAHYTELTLRQLNQLPQKKTVAKIKSHLASLYRVFLRQGFLELLYNGEPVKFSDPPILFAPHYKRSNEPAKEWRKEIELHIAPGMRIHGFAALLDKGSTTNAGFALLRRHRVIVGSDDEGYRPAEIFGQPNSFVYQRLFGELHLEGFDVSHTKDGIQWNYHEDIVLSELKKVLNDEPLPLLEQAREYRVRANGNSSTKANVSLGNPVLLSPLPPSKVESSGISSEGFVPILAEDNGENGKRLVEDSHSVLGSALSPQPLPIPSKKTQKRELRLVLENEIWTVRAELTNDPAVGEWLSFISVSENAPEIDIRIALNHPFVLTYCSNQDLFVEPFVRLASSIAVAEIAARNKGIRQVGTVRKLINQMLRDGFKED